MSLSLLKQRSLKELFNLVFNALRDLQTFEQSRNIFLDIQVEVNRATLLEVRVSSLKSRGQDERAIFLVIYPNS